MRQMADEKRRQEMRENVRAKARESIEEKERLARLNQVKEVEQRRADKSR